MMKLISILLFCLTLVYSRDVLNKDTGVICALMKTGKNPTYIEVGLDKISSKDDSVKFPIFILHYTDLLEISHLPNAAKYQQEFVTDKQTAWSHVNPDTDDVDDKDRATFIVEYSKDVGKYTLNKPIVHKGDPAHYEVAKDGYYCVYIAQPLEVHDFEAPITFKQTHGNLPYLEYTLYVQKSLVLVVSIIIFVYLLYYILKFKVGKDFSNLNSLSIISRATIFYVMFPYIVTTAIQLTLDFVFNKWIKSSSNNIIFNLLNFGSVWLGLAFVSFYKYMILIFAMGFGTVYYTRGNTKNYRELPTKLHQISYYFLIANLVANTLVAFSNYEIDNYSGISNPGFQVVLGVFGIIWTIMSIIYYFKTKKLIAKFPPISNTNNDSTDLNANILKSFRNSIIVIFFLPVIINFISVVYFVLQSKKSVIDTTKLPPASQDPDGDVLSIITADVLENTVFRAPFDVLFLNASLDILLPVVCIYAIWIRTNTGLIIEENSSGDGYANVNEFIISDDDYLQPENENSDDDNFNNGSSVSPPDYQVENSNVNVDDNDNDNEVDKPSANGKFDV